MTFILALWGAFLSTILAYHHLSADWPRLVLVRDDDDSRETVLLLLKNEGKHSLLIHKIRIWIGEAKIIPRSKSTSSAVRTAMNTVMHNDLQLIVEPEEEYKFTLEVNPDARLIAFSVHWNSARLRLLPRIPLVAFIRHSQLAALSRTTG